MARISPSLLIIVLALPFILLVATGNIKIPGAITGFQAAQFDPLTQINGMIAYNCNNSLGSGWFGYAEPNPGSGYYGGAGCSQSVSNTGNKISGGSQSFTLTPTRIGSDSNDNAYVQVAGANCVLNNIGSNSCAHASVYLPNMGITGTMQYPYNQIDANFQNLYGEPPPPAFPINLGSDTSYRYYMFEYGFAVRLQIVNDVPSVTFYCLPPIGASRCQSAEQAALSQALGFVNANNALNGKIGVDITVPNTLVTSPTDKLAIIGAFTAAGGCKQVSTLSYGGVASIQQCSSHTIIPVQNLPYTPFSYSSIGSFTSNQAANIINSIGCTAPTCTSNPGGTSLTSITALITITNMQVKYNAVCQGSGGCGAVTGGDPYIQADMTPSNIQIDVPIIFYVLDASTIPPPPPPPGPGQCQYGGTYPNCNPAPPPPPPPPGACGGLPSCPQPTSNFGAVNVHVQDAVTGFALGAMQVSLVGTTGGGCGASSYSSTTNNSGNFNFTNVGAGSYLVCASGGTGSLSLFFFTIGVQYNSGSSGVNAVVGQTSSTTIVLYPNLMGSFTTFSIIAIAAAIVLFVIVIIVAPSSLVTLGLGGVRGYRQARRR